MGLGRSISTDRIRKNRRRVNNRAVILVPICLGVLVSQRFLSTSIQFQSHGIRRVGSRLSRLDHVNYRTDVVSIRASCETERLERAFDLSGYVGSIDVPFLRLTNPQEIVELLYSEFLLNTNGIP